MEGWPGLNTGKAGVVTRCSTTSQGHAGVGHGIEMPVQLGNGLRVGFLFVDGVNE